MKMTVYDVIIEAYLEIKGPREVEYYTVYKSLGMNEKESLLKGINSEFYRLLDKNITTEKFIESKNKVLAQALKEREDAEKMLAVHLMVMFDFALEEREEYRIFQTAELGSNRVISTSGPFGESEDHLYLYHNDANFCDKMIEKLEIRKKKIRAGIWEYIKNYIIAGHEKYNICIKEYKSDILKELVEKRKLKLGIVPYGRKMWYDIEQEGKGIVIADKEDSRKQMNERYIELIRQADAYKADILIFPEMAMNSRTLSYVKKYLAGASLGGEIQHLKLIFLGSLWQDYKNKCYLLSSSGSVLLENDKKNSYEKDGYIELLKEISEDINLIDIKGLGRIWYMICKDGLLHKDVVVMYECFDIQMSFISAYSPGVDEFVTNAEDIAKKYYASCVMANSCLARKTNEKDDTTGFLSLPAVQETRKNARCYIESYGCKYNHSCDNCCIWTFDIDLDNISIKDSDGIKTVGIEKNCVYIA